MRIEKDIKVVRELLNLEQKELAELLGVSIDSIVRWEQNLVQIDEKNLEVFFNFAYNKGIKINKIYEQLLYEDCENNELKLLFHGAKSVIKFPVDLKYSKENNDFGIGFYLGENFEQVSTYITNTISNYVYAFSIDIKNLNVIKFNVDTEWMLAVAYYRGWIAKYKKNEIVKKIIEKVAKADIIIAPIADNRMFDLISDFVDGSITNEQCEHALSATNLGNQYVIKTTNGLNNLNFIKLFYLSSKEKEEYKNKRLENNIINLDKVKVARIEYRGKGLYIDEMLT